ncbi:MAG: putative N-acetylmannosamine-6-phosphate 2-epimerase [Devosia sp.]|nr:putative N-acetylmannosamine-6-phosphate 2-epimerase [Devosia sp.]
MHINDLRNGLVVSCQPVPGGPMDSSESVVAFALAALAAGARALRIESLNFVRHVRAATTAPIIGIVKQDREDSPVRITPTIDLLLGLCDAGADIVAFDATRRTRPVTVRDLVAAAKARGRLTMADCSDIEDAREALAAGVDIVGTTMSGYAGGPVPVAPDLALITAIRKLTANVIAEGRFNSPALAGEAIRRGAMCVVVGSAITRTEHVTSWFKAAVDAAATPTPTILAVDIGGTKLAAALVENDTVRDTFSLETGGSANPGEWLRAIAAHYRDTRHSGVAFAVSGLIEHGCWSALNPATLRVPTNYPLVETAEAIFKVPAIAFNDAQAAAWGEYAWGAGEREDLAFLTISTGIGGGAVVNGKLLGGLAGHFGLWRSPTQGLGPLEDQVSGRWLAAQAQDAGFNMDAKGVFAAATAGERWAHDAISASAAKVANLCADVQLAFDPRRIVIGGGIGLGEGFLDLVAERLSRLPLRLRPVVTPARLGPNAGIVGIASLASIG